jgi:small-conductance mechanosensitive channel
MALIDIFWQNLDLIWAALAIIIAFSVAKVVNYILRVWAVKLTVRTKTDLDDMLIKAMRRPILLGFVLYGFYYALTTVSYLLPHAETVNLAFLFIEVYFTAYVISKFIVTFIDWYAKEVAVKTESKMDDHFLPPLKKVVYIIALLVSTIFLMDRLGVEITTLIATLGIGGLAVALALQDTLSNFFAGSYTTLERSIRLNDFIQLETGETGYVTEIGWRTTKIRKLDNNVVIIPNNKLAQSKIINFDLQDGRMSVGLACGISYDSDLDKVEKIALEETEKIMKKHSSIDPKKYPPTVRFNEFGDSNIKFNIWFNVKQAKDQFREKHELIKSLKKRFDKEGIVIEYPIVRVYGKEKQKRKGI